MIFDWASGVYRLKFTGFSNRREFRLLVFDIRKSAIGNRQFLSKDLARP
jgi:hypothetical protein